MTMNTDIKVGSGRLERMMMTLLELTICDEDMKKKKRGGPRGSKRGERSALALSTVSDVYMVSKDTVLCMP